LGVAFKENVCDARNTRVTELVRELENHGVHVTAYDPLLRRGEMERLNLRAVHNPFHAKAKFDAVVLAVPHRIFQDTPAEAYVGLLRNGNKPAVFVDVKGVLQEARSRKNVLYWSL